MASVKKHPKDSVIDIPPATESNAQTGAGEPIGISPDTEISPATVLRVKNRLHQEWIEERPQLPNTPTQAFENQVVQVIEEDELHAPSAALDPIEQLLEEISGSLHEWSMTVYRLLNYDRDFNGSLKARKSLCGSQPFDTDYEDVVQRLYAKKDKPNNFLVVVRRDNRIYKILPVVSVEPDDEIERTSAEPSQSNNAISANGATTNSGIAELKKSIGLLRELQSVLPQSATQPAPVQSAEMSPEAAMLKLLEVDPDKLATVRKRIFGEEIEAGSSWFTELKPFLPTIIQGISGFFMSRQAEPSAATQTQIAAPPAQPTTPPNIEDIFFQTFWNAAQQNANHQQFAEWLFQFETTYPEVAVYLNTITECSPAQAAHFLRRNAPSVTPEQRADAIINWISELQKVMTEPEEESSNDASGIDK